MSILFMILAMGQVPGGGSEKISGEMKKQLDLRGDWEGICHTSRMKTPIVMHNKIVTVIYNGRHLHNFDIDLQKVTEEGDNRLRFKWMGINCFGIYQQDSDRLRICFSVKDWPTSYRVGDYEELLILRRKK